MSDKASQLGEERERSGKEIVKLRERSSTFNSIIASSTDENDKVLLCQLYESLSLLAELGTFVSKDVEKLLANEGTIISLQFQFVNCTK
uniref:Uncharacterized protein n=1 Tax=Elaeophora elaphi TaxID=1147741 RepID=A0A0R3S3U4_9BILA